MERGHRGRRLPWRGRGSGVEGRGSRRPEAAVERPAGPGTGSLRAQLPALQRGADAAGTLRTPRWAGRRRLLAGAAPAIGAAGREGDWGVEGRDRGGREGEGPWGGGPGG